MFFATLTVFFAAASHYTADWESLDKRPLPSWFDRAKFGIFLHWGVYSVPSFRSEWYWIYHHDGKKEFVDFQNKVYGPDFKYQDFAPMFKAKLFDPKQWADMFKKAGARYVVLTSKHHEGFTLWPSNVSWNWNAMDIGPHRDLVGDLGKAVRDNGMHYGLYHSLFEWFNPLYLEDRKNNYTTREFVTRKAMVELREIVEQYHPDLIWSDGDWEATSDYWQSTDFLAWLYNESPVKDTVVVNDRWGKECPRKHGGYYNGGDRQQPEPELLKHKWENAMTVDKGTWGFSRVSPLSHYLDAQDIVTELVSSVAFNGNLLLDVGPTSDGIIEPIFEERLMQIGKYLELNGRAIYESSPCAVQNITVEEEAYCTQNTQSKELYVLTVGDTSKFSRRFGLKIPRCPVDILDAYDTETAHLLVHDTSFPIQCSTKDCNLECSDDKWFLPNRVDKHGLVLVFKQKERVEEKI